MLAVISATGLLHIALAQDSPRTSSKPRSTIVEVELLTGPDGSPVAAQDWRTTFEQLGLPLRVRRAVLNEKPAVEEKMVGTLRYVTVVGQLDRAGRIAVAGKSFAHGDGAKLKEWLDDLKTYGAQGSPSGQPLWGLSQKQFEALYVDLGAKAEESVQGLSLAVALPRLGIPVKYPVRFSTAADEHLHARKELAPAVVRQNIAGFSKATALAIVLNDFALGFRPGRTPDGTIELVIEPQAADRSDHWPVGWPLQQQAPLALPGLFVMTNVELDEVPLPEVLEVVAELTQTPVLIDHAEFERRRINLAAMRISHPIKKTTWSIALRNILVPRQLTREYWQDEAGRPFVWVTASGKPRPASVKGVDAKTP